MYDQLTGGSIYHAYMCIVLYLLRADKFGVAVFKASMFFEGGSASRSDYICQVWCSGMQGIYTQLKGGNVPWVYVHCAIYETFVV